VNDNARVYPDDDETRGRIGRIEALIDELERTADPAARRQAQALLQAVLEFHGAALGRILAMAGATGPPGRALIAAMAGDDLVSNLLMLHGLHPDSLEERVARALDQIRPRLGAHGGDVELVGIEAGVVRLRMKGSCHSCPSSSATLTQTIEDALYAAAPDAAGLDVEGIVDPAVPPLVTLGPTLHGATGQAPLRRDPE
jgi:Fe-S cluster biogenesis protein NfuA